MMENSPEVNVRGELDATKKKLERYTELIAKLYDELDSLRSTIASCERCKKRVVKSTAAASENRRSPSPVPLWRRVLGSGGRKGHAGDTSSQSVDLPKPLQLVLPTAATPFIFPSSEPVPTNYTPTNSLEISTGGGFVVGPGLKTDWSIEYNPDSQQTLELQLAETITFNCRVSAVQFSRSGKYLAVALSDGEIHICDLKTRSKSVLAERTATDSKKAQVLDIQFSPDDVYIATGLFDCRIKIWNVAQKRVCAVLKGHTDPISSVDFSPDGRFLVSASWDFTIRLWRTRDGSSRELSDVASMANSVVFSPLGRYIFSGDNHGFLRSCDTRTDKLVAKWKGHAGIIWCVSFSKDGKGLVSGGKDMLLKYWDVSSDAHHLRFCSTNSVVNTSNAEGRKEIMRFEGHTASISSIIHSSDGRWIFSASRGDRSTIIWDAKTTAWQCVLKGNNDAVLGLDVSPTGQLLASGTEGGRVSLWQINVTE